MTAGEPVHGKILHVELSAFLSRYVFDPAVTALQS